MIWSCNNMSFHSLFFFHTILTTRFYKLFLPYLNSLSRYLMTTTFSLTHQWRRFSSQMRSNLRRKGSTSSNKSSKSSKSVRFRTYESIYYTHSSTEYDRTSSLGCCENDEDEASVATMYPIQGQFFIIDTSEMETEDEAVVRNTNHNRQRGLETVAILIALRTMR